jgi:hypothetical protein
MARPRHNLAPLVPLKDSIPGGLSYRMAHCFLQSRLDLKTRADSAYLTLLQKLVYHDLLLL